MSTRRDPVWGERLLRLALRCHPEPFRQTYGEEMLQYYRETWRREVGTRGPLWATRFLASSVASACTEGWKQRSRVEHSRHAHRLHVVRDVRHAARGLLRVPMLTLTIIFTMGVGIGATTAMYAVLNAVVLRPLPYSDAADLVRIYTDSPPNRWPFSVADYRALDEQQTSLSALAGYRLTNRVFQQGGIVERVSAKTVTPGYFSLLGIEPLYGTRFAAGDGAPGTEPKVIVSHGFWQRHLNGEPGAIGRLVRLDGAAFTVVAVLPPDPGPLDADLDVFTPVEWGVPPRKGPFFITVLARLAPGREPAVAGDELRTINRRIFPIWQASYQDQRTSWSLERLKTFVIGDVATALLVVLSAAALVLLIAAANATNLLLARSSRRTQELAVRVALGASRRRLMQHVLAESAVLAVCGAAVAILVALGGITLVTAVGAEFIPRTQEVAFDTVSLRVLVVLTLASSLLVGAIPAIHAARTTFTTALQDESRSTTEGARGRRIRRALVVAEFAVAAPLLVGASLLIGTLVRLQQVDPGFGTDNLLTAAVSLPAAQYSEPGRIQTFWDELRRRLEELPGVAGVTFADSRPPVELNMTNNFDLLDRPTPPGQIQPTTPWVGITPGYFALLGVPVVEGRVLVDQDLNGPGVVVVDEAWARRFYPGETALGRQLHSGGSTTNVLTVVGVVGTVKHQGLSAPDEGTVYWPRSRSTRFSYVLVRTATEPAALVPPLRRVVRELDPALPLADIALAEELIDRSLENPRYLAVLVTAFAGVALFLSVIGIYGVMAYFVQQRVREIGIRLALGASLANVVSSIVGVGMRLAAFGVLAGLAGALALTRYMSNLLFEVSATDLRTFAGVSLFLLGLALVACLAAARRAASIHPALMLRDG